MSKGTKASVREEGLGGGGGAVAAPGGGPGWPDVVGRVWCSKSSPCQVMSELWFLCV